jgi:thiamine-monophosphate kinase
VPLNTPARDTSGPLASFGERALIQRIRDRFPAPAGILDIGIGDDAAVTTAVRGELQVLTTDALVEGVHFDRRFSSLADVGYKALAVNVSDVAAMGGTPRLALLSLILPRGLSVADVDGLLDGFAEMAAEAGVALAGGNITTSPGPLVVDVTAVGSVRRRRILTRGGGKPGDLLYVTGSVGAAAAGLGWLRAMEPGASAEAAGVAELVNRHRRPVPRLRVGAILGRSRAATACMDLSDGLADAVAQLAGSSGTGATIRAGAVPVPEAARHWFASQGHDPINAAVAGGDDYELLFAVSPRYRGRLRTVIRQARGVPITEIGELTAAPAILLERNGATEPLPEGFTHF